LSSSAVSAPHPDKNANASTAATAKIPAWNNIMYTRTLHAALSFKIRLFFIFPPDTLLLSPIKYAETYSNMFYTTIGTLRVCTYDALFIAMRSKMNVIVIILIIGKVLSMIIS
jgi:hypothetical protein